MSLKDKAVKGILWSFLERWGGQLISTTVFLLLARLLGPEAFGLTALASVFISFMSAFVNQGFVPAIVQKEELTPQHLDTAFWSSLLIGSLMCVGTVLASGVIAQSFGEDALKPIIQWLAITFILIAFESVQVAILQRDFDFKKLALRSLVATFISGLAGLCMALLGFGVWSLVVQQLVNRSMNVVVLWSASPWRPGLNASWVHFKELSSFGINVMGVNILRFFNQRSDDFLIGLFLGATALGYYTVAYRLLRLMVNILTNTTVSVALPAFSRLQNEPQRLRSVFYRATQLTSLVSFPAFTSVLILAPQLVGVFFGEEWTASIPIMRVLVFAGIVQSVSYFNGVVMLAKGKPGWRLAVNFLGAFISVAGFMIAVNYGIVAVAVAVVVSNYLVAPVSLLVIRKLTEISLVQYFRQYITPLSGSALMAGIMLNLVQILAVRVGPIPLILICSVAGALVYLLVVVTIDKGLSRQIVKLVKQIS